jgi:hypothetical protein
MKQVAKKIAKNLSLWILKLIKNLIKRIVVLIIFWISSILLIIGLICYVLDYNYIDTLSLLFNMII